MHELKLRCQSTDTDRVTDAQVTSHFDVTLRSEFHGSCIDPARNGEASYADPNGAIDAAVKAKLDNYQHDYSERNFLFLPAVMTTSGRISGDFLRLL